MTPVQIGLLSIAALVILLAFRVPAGISLILAAVLGGSLLTSPGIAFREIGGDVIRIVSHYDLSVIPFVILMGYIYQTGAKAEVPSQVSSQVSSRLPAGLTPVLALIMFGFLSGGSVARFLMAGVIPGIITLILLVPAAVVICKIAQERKKTCVDPLTSAEHKQKTNCCMRTNHSDMYLALRSGVRAQLDKALLILVSLIIIGGIFFGIFRPVQAFAVGVLVSVIVLTVTRRLPLKDLPEVLKISVGATARVFLLLSGGWLFGALLTRSLIHSTLIRLIAGSAIPPFLVLGSILFFYIAFGFLFNDLAALVILTPIVYPIISGLGYSVNWFAILAILALMAGALSKERAEPGLTGGRLPPLKVLLHFAQDLSGKDRRVLKTIWPLFVALLIACLIIAAFPDTVTLLPRLMFSLL